MRRRITIAYELQGDRRYDALIQRLRQHGAIPALPNQWVVLTGLTVDELRRDLECYMDSADRLVVSQVASISSRNPIDSDTFETGVA